MKKCTFVFIATLICMILSVSQTSAQITIGSGIEANSGSLLDLKETDAKGANSTHGLALPKVSLREIDFLYPMLDNMADYQAGTLTKDTLDLAHAGLIIYNQTVNLDKGLCKGVYSWSGSNWIRLGKPCPLAMCEYSIESNLTSGLFYHFYCNDFSTTQANALQACKDPAVTNNDGTSAYSYHLMTYKEFVETWNQSPTHFAVDTKYFVNLNGFVTVGIIRTDGSMEVLNDFAPFAGGLPIGGMFQGQYTVRCARD